MMDWEWPHPRVALRNGCTVAPLYPWLPSFAPWRGRVAPRPGVVNQLRHDVVRYLAGASCMSRASKRCAGAWGVPPNLRVRRACGAIKSCAMAARRCRARGLGSLYGRIESWVKPRAYPSDCTEGGWAVLAGRGVPMAQSITIMCPSLSCRCLLRVPERVRGKKVRCGQCGMVFSVPLRPPQVSNDRRPVPNAAAKSGE
jgi:hypothetical protein